MTSYAALPSLAGTVSAARAVTDRPRAGDALLDADEGIEQLYLAHWDRMVRLSVLLVRDQGVAEEIVQDAYVAVHQRWDRLNDPERALAYLRQAIVNRSRSALRHRAVVQRYLSRQSAPADAPGSDESVLGDARRQLVLDALRQLPRRQREVLALRYYLDMSEAEIAETLGVSRGAVKSHASRGAAALRPILDRLGPDVRGG
ncbi:RNA polymerase sigma-70 factor (sigma-E family) [Nocardioides thalensis]|uniref:RNA polymerase sigma-70 factor (Sigma-E family) n=1 Tax=Nocardioides thalensis TaxID=1914755 RepID=A0A853C2T9_9ACTN|nr:RNA polymerase sigma-70 factor (sigma-E family) [Nocardioides thalensis]